MKLTPYDQALLSGAEGAASQMAMRILTRVAQVMGAPHMIDISCAHIDGCLYHGQAALDFAERLVALGGKIKVPTTLNVSSLDLLHPDLYRGDADVARSGRRLMDAHVRLGCTPTWTCAPYQLAVRPKFGEQIAWGESNAIVFANSVLGARTHRYADFLDLCCALTGRAPYAGLHVDENRRGTMIFDLTDLPADLLHQDVVYPVLGLLVGLEAGAEIPVLVGLPPGVSEDRLKALGAASASSGAVALFHAVGSTPEAPTLAAAMRGNQATRTLRVTRQMVAQVRDSLSTSTVGAKLAGVSLGTPHYSLTEFEQLVSLLLLNRVHPDVRFYVSTSRHVLEGLEQNGWDAVLDRAGVQLVVDTCTYITPVMDLKAGVVMTNSGKWAHYAPGNLGLEVVFGSTDECVRSAIQGQVWRDEELWHGV